MLASISLLILMVMFIMVWQRIWTEGFKDFHAIDKLDKTAEPASTTIPFMLVEMDKINKNMYLMNNTLYEMNKMNATMHDMQNIKRDMSLSIVKIEDMTPDISRMTYSIEQMTLVLSTELARMTYSMDRVNNKMPNMDFMPFN